jgi:hypothetical protein
MGASSSIVNIDVYSIYISFPKENCYIENIKNNFKTLNYSILDTSMVVTSLKDLPLTDISKYIEKIIEKTKYIFICISPDTIRSVTQTIEMNELNNLFLDNKQIIYLMTDDNYTPLTNTELKSIIKENKWFPLYNDETFFHTNNELMTLLFNSISF